MWSPRVVEWLIETFTALLEFQLGPSKTAPMKANKPEINLSVVGNIYYFKIYPRG